MDYLQLLIFIWTLLLLHQMKFSEATFMTVRANSDKVKSIKIMHSLTGVDIFTERGVIYSHSQKSEIKILKQNPLKDYEYASLLKTAKQGALYRIKSIVLTKKNEEHTFYSSTPAKYMIESNLTDRLNVVYDNNGNVFTVNEFVDFDRQDASTQPKNENNQSEGQSGLHHFNTKLSCQYPHVIPDPDTEEYEKKMEEEEEKGKEQKEDNRSFFWKYWFYIVPLIIIVVLTGATNEPAAR